MAGKWRTAQCLGGSSPGWLQRDPGFPRVLFRCGLEEEIFSEESVDGIGMSAQAGLGALGMCGANCLPGARDDAEEQHQCDCCPGGKRQLVASQRFLKA